MKFNYSNAEVYAKSCGLVLQAERLQEFDQLAAAHGFTQSQVDVAMQIHIRHIAWLFNPKNYTFKQRILVALYFLFGRKK